MSEQIIFQLQLVLGYVVCWLAFRAYVLPKLKCMAAIDAQRAIATFHSFRFFGLVFLVPGVTGPGLPASFASFAAYWDFATGLLAIAALLTITIKPLFWSFVVAFNVVGAVDLLMNYYHATRLGLPGFAGQLGATYAIPILYVPALMITHLTAFYLLMRPQPEPAESFGAAAS